MAVAPQQQAPNLPPQDLDAEESVLGAMLVSPTAVAVVSEVLHPEDFYLGSHAHIYRTIMEMYGAGETIDSITLTNALTSRGLLDQVGGKEVVHTLAATVPAAANAGHYAQIVRDAATYRSLIRAGTEIATLGYDHLGEPQQVVDKAEQIVFGIADKRISRDFSPIHTLLNESFERLTALAESGSDLTGVSSGLRDLDRITAGFQPSNLVVMAARPGMGKTSLALNISAHLGVRENKPVAIFSLEMSQEEVTQRLMCSEARVDSKRLRTGSLDDADWAKLTNACDKLSRAPIYIDDTAGVSPIEIKAKTRRLQSRLKDQGGLGLVVIDYLQLMGGQSRVENRVQEISQISRSLKLIARDLDVPVIAHLAALARGGGPVRQAAAALRPARVGIHRAGRRPGDVRLPR